MATVIDDVYSALRSLGGQATVRQMAELVSGHEPDVRETHRIRKAVNRMARQHRLVVVGVRIENGGVAPIWEAVE